MTKSDRTIMYVGLAAVGVGVWYFMWGPGKQTGTTHVVSSSPVGPAFVPTSQAGPMLRLPSNPGADPCGTARYLTALGHPQEAAPWASKCAAIGGTV